MNSGKLIKSIIGASLLVGVLTTGSVTASAQSAAHCDDVARHKASRHANGAGVVGGAVTGAVTGAIIGGIIDGGRGAGRGAAIGGGVGVLGGALNESASWQDAYNYHYHRCMNRTRRPVRAINRGHAPRPWTRAWYRYCADKYRSFNPETGRYLAYSGQYRMCR